MRNIFKKNQILTIPNFLSLVRLALIPIIVWLYSVKQEYTLALVILVLSGITDVADGYIARRFNMVSDFGKIFDPIADKLTQAALLFCLAVRYRRMKYLIGIFAVKELLMCIFGLFTMHKTDEVKSAEWFGKANTMLLYLVMGILIIMPGIELSKANLLINVCGVSMIISVALYIRNYIVILKEYRQ